MRLCQAWHNRKNWLFLGSPRGGQVAATVFSLIQTCKALDINPEAYLKDVLTRLPMTKQKDIDTLLPHHWSPGTSSTPDQALKKHPLGPG